MGDDRHPPPADETRPGDDSVGGEILAHGSGQQTVLDEGPFVEEQI